MPLTVTLIIISFPSPTLSFIPDLKPSFSQILPTAAFRTDYMIPQTFTVTSSISVLLFSFFFCLHFLAVGSVGFQAHVKIASRIVSALSTSLRDEEVLFAGLL